jgi:hypothetical protein
MKTIEFKAVYNGPDEKGENGLWHRPADEIIRVQARDINSGFTKALKKAREPLGSGVVREIHRIEFWQVL